jgi:ribose-phosphate pyrophosphokinase
MKVIDSDNYKASGIETFFFPGGEPHARIPEDFGPALLYLKARTWNDVGLALCVLNALNCQSRKNGVYHNIWLFCPYFPGARQDRSDGCTPLTTNIMIDMFYNETDRIYTFDVHSEHTQHSVYHNFMPSDLPIKDLFPRTPRIIIPDKGAKARAEDFDSVFSSSYELIQCEKKRDFATGKFEGFTMPQLPEAAHYLIVDDICDGGGTFNLLAQEFEKNPYAVSSTLSLWVSHGIFSRGLNNISPTIKHIYTTDSFSHMPANPYHDPRLHVVSLQPIIDEILEEARTTEEYKNV